MNKNSTLYSVFSVFSIILPLVLRAVSVFRYPSGVLHYLFYALMILGLVLIAADTFRKSYLPAFDTGSSRLLGIFSTLMALVMLPEFVGGVMRTYTAVTDSGVHLFAVLDALEAIAAFFCALYFAFVSLTFRGRRYDFRSLLSLHLTPVLWAVFKTLGLMEHSGDVKNDVHGMLQQLLAVLMLCFFYCFAQEVFSRKGTRPVTVYFARSLSYGAMLLVFDEGMLLLGRSDILFSESFMTAITAAVLCGFSYSFAKNIHLESE